MLSVIAKIPIKEGKMEEAMAAIAELMKGVAGEAGCLLYTVNSDKNNPNTLVFMERYKDKEALQVHGQTPHFQAFFAKSGQLVAGPPEMTIMKELASK